MAYANGSTVSYTYDLLGRVVKETYLNGRTVDYVYNNNGQPHSVTDSVSGTTYYIYDSLGRLIYFETEDGEERSQYSYDSNNCLTDVNYSINGWDSILEVFAHNQNEADTISDGTLTGMQMATGEYIARTLDYLQRLTGRTVEESLQENYNYTAGTGTNTTTTQVSGKKNTLDGVVISNVEYTYDGNGNIVYEVDAVSGATVEYVYDEYNQLTDAVRSDGWTETYTYDPAGNILTFENDITFHTYTYGDSDWHDLLTAVDGAALTYDAIGNPLSYYNGAPYSMNWTEGRKLASVTIGENTTSYLYDADGLRIKKINSDGSYISYVVVGGTIIGEKHYSSTDTLTKNVRYTFDENGTVCGYSTSTDGITWTDYYFIRNLQGDILQVFRASDNVIVATYSYDSWGNILSATGEKADENPFRYRGYYYDAETGFYATGTRYYDPEIGRFINADSYVSTGQGFIGYNMFAYCLNNPACRKDILGTTSVAIFDENFNPTDDDEDIAGGKISDNTGCYTGGSKADILAQNIIQGRVFEKQKFSEFSSKYNNAAEQVTIKTSSGVKTRVDAIGLDENGRVVINEFKSSVNARLTYNQRYAFSRIYTSGGVVVGQGKGIFRAGYVIPAGTEVIIIRP